MEKFKALGLSENMLKALEVLGPRYATRAGGYMRIIKLGKRQGDGADVGLLEFV